MEDQSMSQTLSQQGSEGKANSVPGEAFIPPMLRSVTQGDLGPFEDSSSSQQSFSLLGTRSLHHGVQADNSNIGALTRNKTQTNLEGEFATIASKIQNERLLWSRSKKKTKKRHRSKNPEQSLSTIADIQKRQIQQMKDHCDQWEEELDELETELDVLEQNIESALQVLKNQVTTVLVHKKSQCEVACERIKSTYEEVALQREETITRIPEMIRMNIDVVMGRVLETALARSGGIHSELDSLYAKSKKSGSLYRLIVNLYLDYTKEHTLKSAFNMEERTGFRLRLRGYHIIGLLVVVPVAWALWILVNMVEN